MLAVATAVGHSNRAGKAFANFRSLKKFTHRLLRLAARDARAQIMRYSTFARFSSIQVSVMPLTMFRLNDTSQLLPIICLTQLGGYCSHLCVGRLGPTEPTHHLDFIGPTRTVQTPKSMVYSRFSRFKREIEMCAPGLRRAQLESGRVIAAHWTNISS